MCYTRFSRYFILLGFTLFYWVLLGFTGFYWVLLGFTGYYWVLLGFTGLYWVLLGFTGCYWVTLSWSTKRCRATSASADNDKNRPYTVDGKTCKKKQTNKKATQKKNMKRETRLGKESRRRIMRSESGAAASPFWRRPNGSKRRSAVAVRARTPPVLAESAPLEANQASEQETKISPPSKLSCQTS